MKKEKWLSHMNITAAIAIAALVISASVTLTLFDRGAYGRLSEKLDLPASSGMSDGEVLENYNALIDYNSVFYTGPLSFPTLPMSEAGRIHFEEVKAIFCVFQIVFMASAALAAFCSIMLLRRRRFLFLALGGIMALAIPAAALCVMAVAGWDRFFVMFHEVFFSNDYWVFDALADPVILILPDAFFFNCLVRIVIGVVAAAVLLIVCPALIGKHTDRTKKRTFD